MESLPELQLHGYWRSGSTWRLRLYFEYRGIPYVYVPVNLVKGEQGSEEYTKKNPAKVSFQLNKQSVWIVGAFPSGQRR